MPGERKPSVPAGAWAGQRLKRQHHGAHLMGSFLFSKSMMVSIMPFMLTISLLPRFRGSLKSDLVMRSMPSTQSSM